VTGATLKLMDNEEQYIPADALAAMWRAMLEDMVQQGWNCANYDEEVKDRPHGSVVKQAWWLGLNSSELAQFDYENPMHGLN